MDQNNESSGVRFEEDTWSQQGAQRAVSSYATEIPKIVQVVIKCSGGTISERQAEYVLFGFVVLMLAVSFFLFFNQGSRPNTSLPLGTKIIYPQNAPPRLEQQFQ